MYSQQELQNKLNSRGFFSISRCKLQAEMQQAINKNTVSEDLLKAIGREYDLYRRDAQNITGLSVLLAASIAGLGVSIHYQFIGGIGMSAGLAIVAAACLYAFLAMGVDGMERVIGNQKQHNKDQQTIQAAVSPSAAS